MAFGLERLEDFQMNIIYPGDVKVIENGKEFHILMNVQVKNRSKCLNIKWKGCINGYFCIGCELVNFMRLFFFLFALVDEEFTIWN